jgi:uncharacterized membrane protein
MSDQRFSNPRVAAIDWLRGLVMVLMLIDHASLMFNEGRVAQDTAALYVPGSALPVTQFFTRWITHLCAPTFLFLAGTALALSAERRRQAGASMRKFDRDMAIRGALIVLLDVVWMSSLAPFRLFQVLYAIGASMLLMIPLRRLPDRWLVIAAIGWFVGGEALTSLVWQGQSDGPVAWALTVAFLDTPTLKIPYPVIPWLAMMMLGWAFGNHLVRRAERGAPPPLRLLVLSGLAGLAVFGIVRGFGSYGNMFLPADDGSLVQWLHVSKYPPSLSFVALELGLMALVLALFLWLEPKVGVRKNGLFLVLGQTALFFYVVHFTTLGAASFGVGIPSGGLGRTYLLAAIWLVALYPVCWLYRRYKQSHPTSVLRFI